MVKIDQQKRIDILEPLFELALGRARQNTNSLDSIDARLVYCLKILAGNNPIPASPREMAQLLMDMAHKLGEFTSITEHAIPHEVNSWTALELLARDLIKVDGEKGIRCVELATLYQIRYWTQSPSRFKATTEEKAHYVGGLATLLGNLDLLNIEFRQFDNWYIPTLD